MLLVHIENNRHLHTLTKGATPPHTSHGQCTEDRQQRRSQAAPRARDRAPRICACKRTVDLTSLYRRAGTHGKASQYELQRSPVPTNNAKAGGHATFCNRSVAHRHVCLWELSRFASQSADHEWSSPERTDCLERTKCAKRGGQSVAACLLVGQWDIGSVPPSSTRALECLSWIRYSSWY